MLWDQSVDREIRHMSNRSGYRSGITLIEVVAAVALMGTLLTTVIVGNAKHVRQMKAAQQKREAVHLLDQFLATWSLSGFDKEVLQPAVNRSGMTATGSFGVVGFEQSDERVEKYKVRVQRKGDATFGTASRVRLTVSCVGPERAEVDVCWAEVLVDL